MSDKGISESRFYMWRAVFALAHADGRLAPEEQGIMDRYLTHVPFSDEQRQILLEDMADPQEVGEMLSCVTEPEDQGQFFEFARLMAYSDRSYDADEQDVIESHLERQMAKFNLDHLSSEIGNLRQELEQRREREDEVFAAEAERKVGLGQILSHFFRPKN